jgi:hypothetical protein
MDGSRSRWDLGLLMLGVAMVLASPHAHGQDLVLLVAAAAPVASRLWSERLPWPVALGSGLGWLLFYWLLPQQELFGVGRGHGDRVAHDELGVPLAEAEGT